MLFQNRFNVVKKIFAVAAALNLILPAPAYSARELRTKNSPFVLAGLEAAVLATDPIRSELRKVRFGFQIPEGQGTEFFTNSLVSLNLGNFLNAPFQTIPNEIVGAIQASLEQSRKAGFLKQGYVKDFAGTDIDIHITHQFGDNNASVHFIIYQAVIAGIRRAHEMGLTAEDFSKLSVEEVLTRTEAKEGELTINERGSESVGVTKYIGAGIGAGNTMLWHQFADIAATPLQTLTGDRINGFRFVVRSINDIREGKAKIATYEFEISQDEVDPNNDVPVRFGKNQSLPLLLLAGKADEYVITEVYPVIYHPKKGGISEDQPLAQVIYKPIFSNGKMPMNPIILNRLQSGGQAVGTAGSMSHFPRVVPGGPNGDYFVTTRPTTLEDARRAPEEGYAASVYYGYQSFDNGNIPVNDLMDHLGVNPEGYYFETTISEILHKHLVRHQKGQDQPALSPLASMKRVVPLRNGQDHLFSTAPKESDADPYLESVEKRVQSGELVVWNEDKADIFGKWGHTSVPEEGIAVYKAAIAEAIEAGKITDGNTIGFKTLFDQDGKLVRVQDHENVGVGDDGHTIWIGDTSINSIEAHKLAFLAFTRGYLYATIFGRKWYGTGQDFQGPEAKAAMANPFKFSQLTPRFFELLRQAMPLKSLESVDVMEQRWIDWKNKGGDSTISLAETFTGNVSKQGMGSARYAFKPGEEKTVDVLAGDKMGPAAKNPIVKNMVFNAVAANAFEHGLVLEIWDVKAFDENGNVPLKLIPHTIDDVHGLTIKDAAEKAFAEAAYTPDGKLRTDLSNEEQLKLADILKRNHFVPTERIFLDVEKNREDIITYLADSDRFNVKHVWGKKQDGWDLANPTQYLDRPLAALSVTRLGIVASGEYVGKDDPVMVGHSKLLHFAHEYLRENPVIVQGDRNGSHWEVAVPSEMKYAIATKNSFPILVGLRYTLSHDGKKIQDVHDLYAGSEDKNNPNEWDAIRRSIHMFNGFFEMATFSQTRPHLTSELTVESAYDLMRQILKFTSPKSPYLTENKPKWDKDRIWPVSPVDHSTDLYRGVAHLKQITEASAERAETRNANLDAPRSESRRMDVKPVIDRRTQDKVAQALSDVQFPAVNFGAGRSALRIVSGRINEALIMDSEAALVQGGLAVLPTLAGKNPTAVIVRDPQEEAFVLKFNEETGNNVTVVYSAEEAVDALNAKIREQIALVGGMHTDVFKIRALVSDPTSSNAVALKDKLGDDFVVNATRSVFERLEASTGLGEVADRLRNAWAFTKSA